ncbi:Ig-like domain-containing protein, partial [Haloferula sp. A504]|uniref:Ig-like domain-containing protein n=1 Tax=Haloferula sp. A504 TaxID=3373601 RepID=UPI0031C1EE3D|nr:Ig-like domain-containing protein [Verrucomicrobiaceae bacterium E54]
MKPHLLVGTIGLIFGTSAQAEHYKVFLLGGQSNMTGNGPKTSDLTEAQKAPQDDVWIYGGTDESASKLGPLQPGFGSSYGPEISFGRAIADGRPYEDFALIKFSKGGTHLYGDWDPTTGYAYNRLKTTVGFGLEALTKAGHTYEVVGMLWTQGERDAANGRTTAEYEADLNEFIADIRARYGADVAFFISRLSILQTGREPGLHDIRAAQDNVAAADPNAYLIDTDSFDISGDNIHFTGTGLVALGNAFGQAYLNSLPVDASAPQIDTLSPVHTAPAVEPTANLSITFDEEVVFGTGDITLRQTGGTLVESYDVAAPSTNLTLSGNTLTIDPSSLLAASTGYYIEIAATAIVDHSGNPYAGISSDGTWSFTTSAGDVSAPTLKALNPANGANNVRINQNLSITFSENIALGTGNIELRLTTGGTLVESYDVASPPANLSISGGTLTINPTSDLAPSTGYYLEIDAAAIDDHAGNSFGGLNGSGAWALTTAAPVIDGSEITATASRTDFNSDGTARGTPDKSIDGSGLSGGEHGSAVGTYCLAPTTIYNPVEDQWFQWDLGASHTLGSIHVWNFDLRSVDIYFSNVAIPGGTGSGNWTRLGGASLELPAAGSPNTGFDLATATGTTLPITEVRHIRFEANTNWSGGNGVALSEIQFSASPAAEDETPPEIQTLSPAHTATGVALASNLSVTFNENVAFGTGAIRLLQSGGTLIESFNVASPPAGLTLSGNTVTINPSADLAESTIYYVEIDDTAIDDLVGNSFSGFSGDGTWRFTSVSVDTTRPTINSLNPTHTATGISYSSNLVINFSENVAFGTGAIRLRRQSDNAVIESFDVENPPPNLTLSGSSVTLNPTADLAPATTYYVEIDATAIDDLAGNSFAGFTADGTWRFTTFVPDTTLPTISTLNPNNGATGVPVGANLVITFGENIAFGTGGIRLLQSGGGAPIESFDVASPPSGLTLSGATVTLNPSSDLALATTYYVEIDDTAIDDLAGNSFAGFLSNGTWSFTTSSSATTAAITFVGTQDNMETKNDDPTVGWRNTTPAKTLDIDGDNIIGTDGYRTSNRSSNPSYA